MKLIRPLRYRYVAQKSKQKTAGSLKCAENPDARIDPH